MQSLITVLCLAVFHFLLVLALLCDSPTWLSRLLLVLGGMLSKDEISGLLLAV